MVKTYIGKQEKDDFCLPLPMPRGIEFSLIKTQEEFDYLMSNPNRKLISIENFYEDRK